MHVANTKTSAHADIRAGTPNEDKEIEMITTASKETTRKTSSARQGGSKAPSAIRKQVEAVLEQNYAFMDSPAFHTDGVEDELFGFEAAPALPLTSWYQPTREDALNSALTGTPQLMKGPEEKLMFMRFNYAKFKLSALKTRIQTEGITRDLAGEFLEWHRRFEHFREYLVRTNLALVLAMAKRSRLGDADFAEVVSEGNMALIRAVDKFSVERGFKFSTYACRAILKAFSRTAMKASKLRTRFPVEFEPDLERSDWIDRRRDEVADDLSDEVKTIVNKNLANLTDVEETVIKRRFNWEMSDDTPLTLEQVGQIIGVTKERVRQIQNKALLKIRGVMEGTVLKSKLADPVAVPA